MAALKRVELVGLPVALLALALTRLLPEGEIAIYLRLAAATVVFFYPGYLTAVALGRRSFSATLAASLGLLTVCMGVMFLTRSSFSFTLLLYFGCGLIALVFAWWKGAPKAVPGSILVLLAGVALGILLWRVAGVLRGDALFHIARTRKLLELNDLSLGTVNEFADGSLHPGYAFPLWHGLLAAIARISGVDPSVVVLHEPSALAPAAFLIAYEAGWAIFRSVRLAVTALIAQVALVVVAPGHGGSYAWLALPGTAGRHLLVPMVVALFFFELDRATAPGLVIAGIASLVLAVVHVTYVIYAVVPLGAFVVTRRLVSKADFGEGVRALTSVAIPALLFMAAITPLVGSSASYDPSQKEVNRAIKHYGSQVATYGDGRYAVAPEVLVRWGAVSVAALVLTALAFMAAKKRWSAFVLGGSLAVCGVTLLPWLFMPFSNLVSISQARRLAMFYPYAFAFAGGLGILAGLLRRYTLALALAAGIALQLAWPGDFGYRLHAGGAPGWLAWAALAAICISLIFFFLSPEADFDNGGGSIAVSASALFALPIVLAGLFYWSPLVKTDKSALTPGLTRALRQDVPKRAIVLAAPATSYRILAAAPVYVVTAPPGNVADTRKNRPYQRRRDFLDFLASGDLGAVVKYKPGWIVLSRAKASRVGLKLKPVYKDDSFVLYRIPPAKRGQRHQTTH
jgi:hypothetical protein